jgi:hypothetical protein
MCVTSFHCHVLLQLTSEEALSMKAAEGAMRENELTRKLQSERSAHEETVRRMNEMNRNIAETMQLSTLLSKHGKYSLDLDPANLHVNCEMVSIGSGDTAGRRPHSVAGAATAADEITNYSPNTASGDAQVPPQNSVASRSVMRRDKAAGRKVGKTCTLLSHYQHQVSGRIKRTESAMVGQSSSLSIGASRKEATAHNKEKLYCKPDSLGRREPSLKISSLGLRVSRSSASRLGRPRHGAAYGDPKIQAEDREPPTFLGSIREESRPAMGFSTSLDLEVDRDATTASGYPSPTTLDFEQNGEKSWKSLLRVADGLAEHATSPASAEE